MAVQQRRGSKTRKRKRRTHYKLRKPTLVRCNHCGQLKVSHRVCPNCGYYKDTQYLDVEPVE